MNATRKAETVAGACGSRPLMRDGAALRIQIQLLLLAASLGAGSAITLRAQIVNDGGTVTLASVTNTLTGTVTVGTNGSFTLLTLGDNALLTNSLHGVIGRNVTAKSNEVRLVSATARWLMGGSLFVGSNGAFNRLLISNGARVGNNAAFIGLGAASINNEVMVTGSGSFWTNRSHLYLGEFGSSGNRLVISNGALVVNNGGLVGFAPSSTNNSVLVTGAGSTWSNRIGVSVGQSGSGNLVTISDGGRVFSSDGYVGAFSSQNQGVVTGTGSHWINQAEFFVGYNGAGGQLRIENGGLLVNSNGHVGFSATSSSNIALVTGSGSLWSNRADLFVGESGGGNQLTVSNGGRLVSASSINGFGPEAHGNGVLVTGAGSSWSNTAGVTLGFSGRANQLQVLAGGTVDMGEIPNLGHFAESGSNGVLVTGLGSRLLTASALLVGNRGSFNQLVVSNGGFVSSVVSVVGQRPTASNNLAVVTGAGSLWSDPAYISIGELGAGNQLLVNNGGTVSGGNVLVGANAGSINNRVTVNGGTLRASDGAGTGVLDVRRGTNVLNAGLVDVDKLVLTNRGTSIPAVFLPTPFGNGSSNNIPSGPNKATEYPSTITVGGLAGSITKVTVTLSNLTHIVAQHLDILLVSPAGQKVMLMSDAGGNSSLTNVTLTFDDIGPQLPNSSAILPGTYRPTDYQSGETMPSPAPTGPYSTILSSFNGNNPNGTWSLYIGNDTFHPVGGNLGGWGVQISTDVATIEERFVDLGVFELNGGTLVTRGASISNDQPFVVGGPGGVPAVWEVRAGASSHFVATDLIVGTLPASSSNNLLHVTGGTLLSAGTLDIRSGTNRLDAGLVDVNRLVITNTRGQFEFNGGTLRTLATTVANGRVFTVGGGVNVATLQLLGGTHTFANNLTVATNGSLIGTGVIDGTVTVSPGGRLTPGAPIGSMDVLGSVILQGTVNLQIDKSGSVRTNDEVTADGAIFYNGTLNVTDIGTDLLAAGDRFFLFDATPYVGAFTTLNLPPLAPGLSWRNNLSVDGSIEVIAAGGQPGIASIIRSGTSIVFAGTNGTPGANYTVLAATNVALPASNWTSIATRQFDAGGGFSFTNAIVPGTPRRFYRLRTP